MRLVAAVGGADVVAAAGVGAIVVTLGGVVNVVAAAGGGVNVVAGGGGDANSAQDSTRSLVPEYILMLLNIHIHYKG